MGNKNRGWVRVLYNLAYQQHLRNHCIAKNTKKVPQFSEWENFLKPFSYNVNEEQREIYKTQENPPTGCWQLMCGGSDVPIIVSEKIIGVKSKYFANLISKREKSIKPNTKSNLINLPKWEFNIIKVNIIIPDSKNYRTTNFNKKCYNHSLVR